MDERLNNPFGVPVKTNAGYSLLMTRENGVSPAEEIYLSKPVKDFAEAIDMLKDATISFMTSELEARLVEFAEDDAELDIPKTADKWLKLRESGDAPKAFFEDTTREYAAIEKAMHLKEAASELQGLVPAIEKQLAESAQKLGPAPAYDGDYNGDYFYVEGYPDKQGNSLDFTLERAGEGDSFCIAMNLQNETFVSTSATAEELFKKLGNHTLELHAQNTEETHTLGALLGDAPVRNRETVERE